MLLQLIRLVPPIGQSSIYPIQKLHYISTCLAEASLMGASLLPMIGKTKSTRSLGSHPKHQIVSIIIHGLYIIGVPYFSQMRWPVGFFVFSQLPNHAHNCLVQSLYQPIHLGLVRHGLQSLDAKDLAQFLNYTTHKASTSIA